MKKSNFILAGLMILLGSYFYFMGVSLEEKARQWPGFFALILIFLSVALIIDSFLNPNREAAKEGEKDNKEATFDKQTLYIILLLIGYLVLMNYIGFLIMTTLFLMATFMVMKYGSMLKKISISLGTAVALTILFQYLLNVPIPQGFLTGII